MNFLEILQNFGFPVACVIALGWYANTTTNKLISLTEKVTNAMSESASSMKELAETIKQFAKKEE